MDLSKIPAGRAPDDFNVVVEIPQGGEPVKYELDKESQAMLVDRFLHTAMCSIPGIAGLCRTPWPRMAIRSTY
jgi:inorganic pyrophosphatase